MRVFTMPEKQRILYIEDELGYQEFVQALFGDGYDLAICSSVEEALGRIEAERWDLILSDINMFGLTGFEVLKKIKADGKAEVCPVIMCSSQSDDQTRNMAMEAGAAGFVTKPFQLDMLEKVVQSFLGKPAG